MLPTSLVVGTRPVSFMQEWSNKNQSLWCQECVPQCKVPESSWLKYPIFLLFILLINIPYDLSYETTDYSLFHYHILYTKTRIKSISQKGQGITPASWFVCTFILSRNINLHFLYILILTFIAVYQFFYKPSMACRLRVGCL